MLKVLHLISGGDVGGAKTHVLTLAKELQKNIQITMICFMDGPFYQDAKDLGINIHLLTQSRRYDLSVVYKVLEIIQKEQIDIVHCHGARANFISRFIKRKSKVPCVTTVHSDFVLDFKGNLYKYLFYTNLNIFALKKFDYFIAVSEDFKQMLISRKFPKEKIFVVYNGIDFNEKIPVLPREDFLTTYGLTHLKEQLLLGIAARLHPVKGHKVLLQAAARVIQKFDHVHLLLAGDGEEEEDLKNYVQKLGIEDHVHFLGFLSNPYDFLHCIDINLLTSFSESFPYVLLEGAKLHKPTIASAVGGIPMLIKDQVTGYLFPAGDDAKLADVIHKAIQNPETTAALGTALHNHAKATYSLESLAKEHVKIYQQMLLLYDT